MLVLLAFVFCFCIIDFDSSPIVYLEVGNPLLFVWLLRIPEGKLETKKVINFVSILFFHSSL